MVDIVAVEVGAVVGVGEHRPGEFREAYAHLRYGVVTRVLDQDQMLDVAFDALGE